MQHFDFVDIPHVPDQKLWDQLRATERQVKEANDWANKAKEKVRKLEECIELTRTKIGEGVNERDKAIQELKQMVTRQKQETRDAQKKVDELELYVQMQEEHYRNRMVEMVVETIESHTQYEQSKAQLQPKKDQLIRKHNEIESKYEEKRLVLLMAETKLMFDKGSVEVRLAQMRKELATMQYQVSMGKEKVNQILRAHKHRTWELVAKSLDKGWQTWSAQAAEL